MEWVEKNVSSDLRQASTSLSERPDVLGGSETSNVALTKRQEADIEMAELNMLRFSLGVTRMDKIRNVYIKGTSQVGSFGEKTQKARLRWYGRFIVWTCTEER